VLPRAAAVAFVASLGLSALPVSAAALPALFYRWNDCDDAAVNLRFAAPGVYRQVLVASGFDQPTGGHTFSILITGFSGCAKATFPDAWRFDEAGCQSGQINWSTAGLGPACPGLVGPNPLYRNSYTYYSDQLGQDVLMTLFVQHDAAFPDAGQTYALWVINYDMRWAVAGPAGGIGLCGDADRSLCFYLISARWASSNLINYPFLLGGTHLTWQDEPSSGFCPTGCTPAVPSTWSRIRAMYR